MRVLLALLVTVMASLPLRAKVARLEFATLVRQSEIVALVEVTSVSTRQAGQRFAKARVNELWKGTAPREIEFLCSPTWTCDIADAKRGERAVVLLAKDTRTRGYHIVYSGRGRFPTHARAGRNYASYWTDVLFSDDIPTHAGSDPQTPWIRVIELETLRAAVAAAQASGLR